MADKSRWAEIVADAEAALASGRVLDPIALRLAEQIIETNELVMRAHESLSAAMKIHQRGTALGRAIAQANERAQRAIARAK